MWPWNLTDDLKNFRAPLLYYTCTSSFVHHFKAIGEIKLELLSGNAQFGSKLANFLFVPCDHEILRLTLKSNRAPLLYYIKLCASFQSQRWIETGATVQKRPIGVGISNFLSRVTLKFDRWPWKSIGHLFYAISSFLHKFNPSVNSNWSYSPETINSVQNRWCFVPCDLEIWRWHWKTIGYLFYATASSVHGFITIKPFQLELQSGNGQFGSKSLFFVPCATLKCYRWPWKPIWHPS